MTRLRVLLMTLLVALLPLSAAFATAPAQSPTEFVRQTSDELIRIVNTSASREARVSSLRTAVSTLIDFQLLSQRTLGAHWEARTPAQQQEFVTLLRQMIERSYSEKLGDERLDPGSYSVTFTGERERRGRHTVEATVQVQRRTHHVEVRMQPNANGSWSIFDIVTDDVSLQESYAESFDEIIRRDGWDALIRRMRDAS